MKSTARKKQSQEETWMWRKSAGRRSEMEKVRRESEKVGKSRNTLFFQYFFCGSGGLKSRLPKAAGAKPAGQMKYQNLHAVVARSTCASQSVKNCQVRTTLKLRCGNSARHCGVKHMWKSKYTIQNTSGSDRFWKLRCRKSARHCGAMRIWKYKC